MSVQIFPPEILDLFLNELRSAAEDPQSRAALSACALVNRQFYNQASPYIFSSLTISTRKRLDGLLDTLNANPDIARHIRSFTVKDQINQTSSKSLSAVFRQLCRLQEFGWIAPPTFLRYQIMLTAMTLSVNNLFSDCPYLTALHFERMMDFPLSVFSSCCHLESLTLIRVVFAKIRPETLSGSLFPFLRRLRISNPWSDDDSEAFGIIMTHAAPTLTTLILSDNHGDRFFLNFKSTIVFPVLESIQTTCGVYRLNKNHALRFLSQFLVHSTPMLAQIQIEISCLPGYNPHDMQRPLPTVFLPIDETLSSPRYRALKTLDLVFVERYYPLQLCSDSSEVRTFLNEILPATSSRSQTEIKIVTAAHPLQPNDYVQVHFVF
ncbi:hypothetical protein BYT27DRAFT_7336549 [Phlegmacium glaucopus]|nr:hypothetical protein BYT27DRAFT_7336549 [Phlegmacium glaucopus]